MSQLIIKVCKIDKVVFHPTADKLDIVSIGEYNCIVGRNQYKINDLVIFCPPDSVIPDDLVEKYQLTYLKGHGKVGTVELRGVISVGLILSIPPNLNVKPGQDVAGILGIKKWEPDVPEFQKTKQCTSFKTLLRKFIAKDITLRRLVFKTLGLMYERTKPRHNHNPLFTVYTDIDNVKNYNNVFTPQDIVVITEKIHGTNTRYSVLPITYGKNLFNNLSLWLKKRLFKQKNIFYYGSHHIQLNGNRGKRRFYGEDVYGQIAERYKLADIIPAGYTLYGEIYGSKIQKGYSYGLKDGELGVVFFDLKKNGKYCDYEEFREFCETRRLPMVPVLYIGNYNPEILTYYTQGKSVLCETQEIREGCVVKCYNEEPSPIIGRKILKSFNPDYLLIKDRTDYH